MSGFAMRTEKKSTSTPARSADYSARRKDRKGIPAQLRARLGALAYTHKMHSGGEARSTGVRRNHNASESSTGKRVAIIQRMRNNVVQRCGGKPRGSSSKTLAEWLKDKPELLKECFDWYNSKPEWWSIDPNNTQVFYRTPNEVAEIRKLPGESGGHHPHGLALGGPKGQKLTYTGETKTFKNKTHTLVTGLQRRVINIIKNQ